MGKKILFILFFMMFFIHFVTAASAKIKKANEIISHSVNKLVGKDQFNKIKNLTFKTSSKDYRTVEKIFFADDQKNFKMTVGYGPYIEQVTLFRKGKISNNNFLSEQALSNYDKTELTCLAKLISGIFTLAKFKDELEFTGKKKFGFKEYYIFKSRLYNHEVSFYLESDTLMLGRMVITGTDMEGISYQSLFDFKEPIQTSGITIPGVWVNSTLAFKEERDDSENKIKNFEINIKINKAFWKNIQLNFGSVQFKNGVISGNVIEPWVHHRLKIMMMSTNIRWSDMEKLNLKQHEDLIVTVGDVDYEGVYFPNKSINPPRHKYKPMVIFVGDIDAPYIGFFMWDKRFREKFENKTPPLLPVKIHKK